MSLGTIPKVLLWLVVSVAAEGPSEFPLPGEYSNTNENGADPTHFTERDCIKFPVPLASQDPGLTETGTGRAADLRKILPALLVLKSVLVLAVAVSISINGLLAGLMLSRTNTVIIRDDRHHPSGFDQPWIYSTGYRKRRGKSRYFTDAGP